MTRAGDFSRTTERLFLARPAIDTRISTLRGRLGAYFLVEGAEKIRLSRDKGRLCTCTMRVLRVRGAVGKQFKGRVGPRKGMLHVNTSAMPTRCVLPGMVSAFRTRCPNRGLGLFRASDRKIVSEVLSRRVSVKFAKAIVRGKGYGCLPFCRSRLIILAPSGRGFIRGLYNKRGLIS